MNTVIKLTACTLVVAMGFVTGFGAARDGKRTRGVRGTVNAAAD